MHLGIIKITYNRNAFFERQLILTLLWQSGASDSGTECFVISLSVCYWLFKCGVLSVVYVCVVAERETRSHNRGFCANTYELHYCVCHTTLSPFRTWTDGKTKRTLLTVFTFILKAKARDYGKGSYISDEAGGVRPITMHLVSWPIRADCACWKVGLCRKWSVWEAGHRAT